MNTLNVLNAYDHTPLGEIDMIPSSDIDEVLEDAYELYRDPERHLPTFQRVDILKSLIRLMESQKEEIIEIAVQEGGKPWIDSTIEVDRAIQGITIAINEMETRTGNQIPMGHTQATVNRVAYTQLEPRGVVLAISAFNHPVNLIVHQVIPAIAAGCPVIVKPASTTPLSCFNFVDLLYQAGLPEIWCQPLVCSREDAERIVSDPRVSFLTFIGSGRVGWHLRSLLAPGAGCALEHGGVAPVIVEKDADLDKVIPALVKGGYYHAGQVCVSVQRVYVHESLIDAVREQMVPRIKALETGDPMNRHTEVGPLITAKEADRVEAWVNEAVHSGARILCGGNRISDTLYEPTLILNPDPDLKVSTQEIFGPVVCIYTYRSREDAIESANALPYSFQAAVFTQDIDIAHDTVKRLKAEAVMVNDHTAFRVDWMPFGGSEHSGLGTGGIGYSMHEMSREKLVVINLS